MKPELLTYTIIERKNILLIYRSFYFAYLDFLHSNQSYSSQDGKNSIGLDISGKLDVISLHIHQKTRYFIPKRDSLTEFFRLRFGLNATYNDWINGNFAYEQRARWLSDK